MTHPSFFPEPQFGSDVLSMCSVVVINIAFHRNLLGAVLDDFLKCSPSKALFATDLQWI